MKTLKILSITLLFLILASAVAGCSSATVTPETITIIETVVVEVEGETIVETVVVEVPAEPEADGNSQEVRFLLHENDPPSLEAYLSMEQEFEAEFPQYDVVVEVTNLDSVDVKVSTVIAAGGTLDGFQPDPAMASNLAQQGLLLSIDDVVDSFGGQDAFYNNTLLIVDDQTYCMPYASGGPVLYYRKDVFEAAGLEPPETWEDLLAAAEAIHSDEMAGIAIPGGDGLYTTIMAQISMWQNGTQVFDIDGNVQLACNERAAEAVQFYSDLLHFAPAGATGYGFGEVIDAYTSGTAAMAVYWGRLLGRIDVNAPDLLEKTGAVPLPYNKMMATFADISYNCVYGEAKYPDAAKAWVEFMARPEQALKLQLTVPGHLAPVSPAQAKALLQAGDPLIDKSFDVAEVLFGIGEYAFNLNLNRGGIDEENLTIIDTGIINTQASILWSSNILARVIQDVFINGADPAEALAAAQIELEEAVSQ